MTVSALYRLALRGDVPAEALTQAERHCLVVALHARGWTDVQIAAHARMTTYTTARIRTGLDLPANRQQQRSAA